MTKVEPFDIHIVTRSGQRKHSSSGNKKRCCSTFLLCTAILLFLSLMVLWLLISAILNMSWLIWTDEDIQHFKSQNITDFDKLHEKLIYKFSRSAKDWVQKLLGNKLPKTDSETTTATKSLTDLEDEFETFKNIENIHYQNVPTKIEPSTSLASKTWQINKMALTKPVHEQILSTIKLHGDKQVSENSLSGLLEITKKYKPEKILKSDKMKNSKTEHFSMVSSMLADTTPISKPSLKLTTDGKFSKARGPMKIFTEKIKHATNRKSKSQLFKVNSITTSSKVRTDSIIQVPASSSFMKDNLLDVASTQIATETTQSAYLKIILNSSLQDTTRTAKHYHDHKTTENSELIPLIQEEPKDVHKILHSKSETSYSEYKTLKDEYINNAQTTSKLFHKPIKMVQSPERKFNISSLNSKSSTLDSQFLKHTPVTANQLHVSSNEKSKENTSTKLYHEFQENDSMLDHELKFSSSSISKATVKVPLTLHQSTFNYLGIAKTNAKFNMQNASNLLKTEWDKDYLSVDINIPLKATTQTSASGYWYTSKQRTSPIKTDNPILTLNDNVWRSKKFTLKPGKSKFSSKFQESKLFSKLLPSKVPLSSLEMTSSKSNYLPSTAITAKSMQAQQIITNQPTNTSSAKMTKITDSVTTTTQQAILMKPLTVPDDKVTSPIETDLKFTTTSLLTTTMQNEAKQFPGETKLRPTLMESHSSWKSSQIPLKITSGSWEMLTSLSKTAIQISVEPSTALVKSTKTSRQRRSTAQTQKQKTTIHVIAPMPTEWRQQTTRPISALLWWLSVTKPELDTVQATKITTQISTKCSATVLTTLLQVPNPSTQLTSSLQQIPQLSTALPFLTKLPAIPISSTKLLMEQKPSKTSADSTMIKTEFLTFPISSIEPITTPLSSNMLKTELPIEVQMVKNVQKIETDILEISKAAIPKISISGTPITNTLPISITTIPKEIHLKHPSLSESTRISSITHPWFKKTSQNDPTSQPKKHLTNDYHLTTKLQILTTDAAKPTTIIPNKDHSKLQPNTFQELKRKTSTIGWKNTEVKLTTPYSNEKQRAQLQIFHHNNLPEDNYEKDDSSSHQNPSEDIDEYYIDRIDDEDDDNDNFDDTYEYHPDSSIKFILKRRNFTDASRYCHIRRLQFLAPQTAEDENNMVAQANNKLEFFDKCGGKALIGYRAIIMEEWKSDNDFPIMGAELSSMWHYNDEQRDGKLHGACSALYAEHGYLMHSFPCKLARQAACFVCESNHCSNGRQECYRFFSQRVQSTKEANQLCHDYFHRGKLAIVYNKAYYDIILRLFLQRNVENLCPYIYVGNMYYSPYETIREERMQYDSSLLERSHIRSNEHCLSLTTISMDQHKFHITPTNCARRACFMCKVPGPNEEPEAEYPEAAVKPYFVY